MKIWYFCMNPNNSFYNERYAPTLHIRATIGGLQSLGHEANHFFFGDERGQTEEKLRTTTKGLGRKSRLLRRTKPMLRDVYELYQNRFQDRKLVEPIFQTHSIDLIYERLFPSKSAVSLCAKKYGIPIIVESNAPAGERKKYWGSPLQALVNRVEQGIVQRADAVTVVSTSLKRHYEALGVPAEKIFVLPNGVDQERFSSGNVTRDIRAERGLGQSPVLGFVGNIHPYHGAELFLPLARSLEQRGRPAHFLIVGGGPGLEQLQESLVAERLDHLFSLVGPVPNAEVPDYLAATDICLLPHFMWYGSPMKIFEYGAMGKAIVAPDLENIREVLQHGRTAYLFEPENMAALTAAVVELLDNVDLRAQLGAAARQHILSNHTWTRNAERIVSIYQQIVASKAAGYRAPALQPGEVL